MAGGKETPRQKMIGMMYLVLTALLALQVSSAIMMKFKFLDDSLMSVNAKTTSDNTSVVSNIAGKVSEGGARAADKAVLDAAQEVRNRTNAMIAEIDKHRKDLIGLTGGVDETGMYVGAKEEEKVAIHMIGGKKNGVAYDLKNKLNSYASFLKAYNPNMPAKLALDGSEDPLAKNDPQQRRKDFATLNFAQTPLVAALAVLAQKESEILKYEADALSTLAQKVGADIIKFEKMFATASAEAKFVAAGTKYNADMFLTASSDAIVPTMTANGKPVKVEGGRGKVEFTAAASNYDSEGQSKQKWKGTITFPFQGRDTTFTLEQEYVVVKPVIKVESQAVSALYFNCGNALNITVPALGALYDPTFSATGGTAIKGAKKGEVTIIPTAKEVKISVSSGGNAIGSETFKVRPIPKPEIEFVVNGRPINTKQGQAAPRVLSVRAKPDETFRTMLPKDARYRVAEWTATLVRGTRPAMAPQKFTAEQANMSAIAQEARPGDRIILEVNKVQRRNFRDQTEEVNVGAVIVNLPIQ